MIRRLVKAAIVSAVCYLVVTAAPDIARYMRMRRM